MTKFLLWLWERSERLRIRIELWAVRVRIREAQAEYDAAADPALKAILFRVLACRRRHHATMLRTLTIMAGLDEPTTSPVEPTE